MSMYMRHPIAIAALWVCAAPACETRSKPASTHSQERPRSAERVLEEAALRRFASSTPKVTLSGGKVISISDPKHATRIKVLQFKELLVKEATAQSDRLPLAADARLRQQKPARVAVSWTVEDGSANIELVVPDTTRCKLEPSTVPYHWSRSDLQARPCLFEREAALLDGVDAATFEVTVEAIAENDRLWEHLKKAEMREVASAEFVARHR